MVTQLLQKCIGGPYLQALLERYVVSTTDCRFCCCRDDPLLDIAMELERVATHDPYFVERGL